MSEELLNQRLEALRGEISHSLYCEVGQYLANDDLKGAEYMLDFLEDNMSDDYVNELISQADARECATIDNHEQDKGL